RKALVDALDDHLIRQAVLQMLELLVGGGMRQKQPFIVTNAHSPDDPRVADGGPDHRDDAGELGFKHAEEIL
ncbi:hypothetical protein NL478_28385, partial [Klebsiella pneumoniae]|nr:hypothetical protein [Klebsiella pneumoniae]